MRLRSVILGSVLGVLAAFGLNLLMKTVRGTEAPVLPAADSLTPIAEKGLPEAQYILGLTYYLGEGKPQDYGEAYRWFLLAADEGIAGAQNYLGVMYAEGQGVGTDQGKALKWFRLAAEQGVVAAQYALGKKYAEGDGAPQDYVRAQMWLNLAASQVSGDTADLYASTRDEVLKSMSSEQVAEAQRLARRWKAKTWQELKSAEE